MNQQAKVLRSKPLREPAPCIVISRHEAVRAVVADRMAVDRFYDFFRAEILRDLPRGSTVIGNLPVPVAAQICRAGHHYMHVMIPNASRPGAHTYASLSRNMELVEFHVEEID